MSACHFNVVAAERLTTAANLLTRDVNDWTTDTDELRAAAVVLDSMGLSISDAIRLLIFKIADEQRLPFDVKAPNKATRRALKELSDGKGMRFKSKEALFKDLGI